MKPVILLLLISSAVFTGCTTAYKTGQTPDDVYYSPLPARDAYVKSEQKEEPRQTYNDQYYEDRYLRMKVQNRLRWYDLDDWYAYERYTFNHNYYFGSYYNPYNTWNYYYNPYCCCHANVVYSYPKSTMSAPPAKPRVFSLASYSNPKTNNSNNSARVNTALPRYDNSNNNSNNRKTLGQTIRDMMGNNSNSNSGNQGSQSTRTYTPSNNNSSSSSSGSSSSSSSSQPVSRPSRGNNN